MAREGVTADMIERAARIVYDREAADPISRLPEWDDFLAACNKRGNRRDWIEILPTHNPDDPEDVEMVRQDYGDDADLILRVAGVVRAVTVPPKPDKA